MKLWLISQDVNTDYDTYDSAVVAAETEEIAQRMSPAIRDEGKTITDWDTIGQAWCNSVSDVSVQYIGEATEGTQQSLICASFNVG